MSWRKITFIVVALIVLLGGSAALSMLFVSLKPEPPTRPEADMKRYVKAETVSYSDVASSLTREGRVVSGNEVPLVSEAAGKIEAGEVSLKKGASFEKGQLLAVIYKDEAELALKARKSGFLTSFTTMLPDIKVDFPDQYDTFLAYFNSIEMDTDLPELPRFQNEQLKIFLASRKILSEYYGIKQDEKKLNRHSLYAPFKGTFTSVNYEVGAYVNTGGQIARMIRTDHIEIEVPVEVFQSDWIRIGDNVEILHDNGQYAGKGIVVRKSNFVEMETQRRSIFVKATESKEDLLPGELYLVEFRGQIIPDAMEIPRSAVFNSNEVFLVVDEKLKKQEINIIKVNETTLIFNGVEEGAKLVSEPLINAKENSPVGILGEEKPANQQAKSQG